MQTKTYKTDDTLGNKGMRKHVEIRVSKIAKKLHLNKHINLTLLVFVPPTNVFPAYPVLHFHEAVAFRYQDQPILAYTQRPAGTPGTEDFHASGGRRGKQQMEYNIYMGVSKYWGTPKTDGL